MTIRQHQQKFLDYIEVAKGRSKKTIETYDNYLDRFVKFCEEKNVDNPKRITFDLVQEFRMFMLREKLCRATQNYHLIVLRSFLKYLLRINIRTLYPEMIELAKEPQKEVCFLSTNEVKMMLEATKKERGKRRLRDQAIIATLFSTGMRVSELVSIDKKDLNMDTGELVIIGKGGKIRTVYLSPNVRDRLALYLRARRDSIESVFVSKHGRITPRSVQRLIKKYAVIAGIKKEITPHTFRHTFSTDLLANGADIRSVQAMLGHTSIITTQIYTHFTNPQLRAVHSKFHTEV